MLREPDELHFTYLDTTGRPVIIMKKGNLVEQHIENFVVGDFTSSESIQFTLITVIFGYTHGRMEGSHGSVCWGLSCSPQWIANIGW